MSVNQVNQTTGALSPIAGGTLYADAPVGSIQAYGGTTAPFGWLLCQGQAVSRATYAELFGVIGTSFGAGDGSTTFNVPDLRGKTTFGVSSSSSELPSVGRTTNGAIPNITGTVHPGNADVYTGIFSASGAFSPTSQGQANTISNVNAQLKTTNHSASFDASRSSSLYKTTSSVIPASVGVNYIIKATTIALPSDFSDQVDDMIDAKIVNNLASGDMRAATSNTVYNCVTVAPTTEDITSCLNTDVATASGVNVTYFHNKQILIDFNNIVPKVAGNGKTLLQNLPFNFAPPQAVSILAVDTSQSATDTHCVIYTNAYNNWLGAHLSGVGKHYYGQIIAVIR